MSGDGELGAFAKDSILGEDTPDEWDQEEESPEGLTEFDFSAPAPKKSVVLRDETAGSEENSDANISKVGVEALVDKVIEEAIPTGQTPKPPPEALTDDVPDPPPPGPGRIDDTREMDSLPPPEDASATAPEMGSLPRPAPAPPPPPPPATPRPGDVPVPAPEARPPPTPAPPPPVDPNATADMRAHPRPKPEPAPLPPPAARPPPTPAPPPPVDTDDAKATAEMAQPELGSRPEPKRRHSVPVGRDVGTEMFDGEAASLQRLVDNSMGVGDSIPVPEELSDEVRAVSKVLMGRTGPAPEQKSESHASLTADLSLDTPSPGAVPPPPNRDPSAPFAPHGRSDTVKPTSSPTGTELEAAQDAFDMAETSGESLELAYEPAERPTPKGAPSSHALLDSVEPDGMGFGTKLAIAGIIVAAIIAVLFIVR